jgi:response regulator NasT
MNESRVRVLVAEDEAIIRLDLVETLRDLGYDVVGAVGDGAKAVELATAMRPDLVILDVAMPVLDGLSAAEQIVSARVAPVLMLTAFSQRELVQRATEAGAMAYLVKPFSPDDLVPAIEVALGRHRQMAALEAEATNLAERLEARVAIDRAKPLLMESLGITEPEAFRWIQRAAMDRRCTMREVAEAVLNEAARGAAGLAGPDN